VVGYAVLCFWHLVVSLLDWHLLFKSREQVGDDVELHVYLVDDSIGLAIMGCIVKANDVLLHLLHALNHAQHCDIWEWVDDDDLRVSVFEHQVLLLCNHVILHIGLKNLNLVIIDLVDLILAQHVNQDLDLINYL
jgi:hypothetical protein